MIASLKSLADRMRRAFGSSEGEEAVLKARLDRRSGADLLRRKRIKVAAMAILFGGGLGRNRPSAPGRRRAATGPRATAHAPDASGYRDDRDRRFHAQ
ncbi:hypothetical protein [Erythrobacter donghaensis]|uniref:hypothetical protein n=1 Tax=Erythrobacter donghaensis TaxID=267135 RepID=UPI000B12F612|nr:hypothetical protein [Erythrobacter donghaensis]